MADEQIADRSDERSHRRLRVHRAVHRPAPDLDRRAGKDPDVANRAGEPVRGEACRRALQVRRSRRTWPASLEGAEVLYNTYWVRFPRGEVTFDMAVSRCRALIDAAERAGVKRIVHVSITNPSADSRLPYFRGKGMVEEAVTGSSLTWAIVRPGTRLRRGRHSDQQHRLGGPAVPCLSAAGLRALQGPARVRRRRGGHRR